MGGTRATTGSDALGTATGLAAGPGSCALINGRYEVVRRLGRGGMGAVYIALDRQRDGAEVALKRIRRDRADEKTLRTIKNEFLILSQLRHPNVMRVHDFGIETATGDIFFTSEIIRGPDWQRLVRDLELDQEVGRRVFLASVVDVLRGLAFIHAQGLVHLDIKPDNVLVHLPENEKPVAKLIDFGLVRREKEFGGKKIMGTTYYIAPETILGARVDGRTDLYSLGAVLYHLLCGRVPFSGRSNIEIFKGHLERIPAPPHTVNPIVSPELAEIVLRLLEKKPADRFQSATEVIDELVHRTGENFSLESRETSAAYLETVGAAGREGEVDTIHQLLSNATKTDGRPVRWWLESMAHEEDEVESDGLEARSLPVPGGRAVLLRGEGGLGKRRVLGLIRSLAQVQGVFVLEIDCEGAADGGEMQLVRGIVGYAAEEDADGPTQLGGLTLDLARAVVGGRTSAVDRTLETLVTTLVASSRSRPVLLLFHSLDRACPLVIDVLRQLVHHHVIVRGGASRLLALASVADRLEGGGAALSGLWRDRTFASSILELRLERLGEDGIRHMIRRAFRDMEVPQDFVRRVREESDGNNELILDILGFCVDRDLIARAAASWVLSGSYETEAIPGRVRAELGAAVERLKPAELALARAFAVLGLEGPLDIAARVAGLSGREVEQGIASLVRERLVREKSEGDTHRVHCFVHKSAREMLYDSVSEEERRELHAHAGQLLEEHLRDGDEQAVIEIAWHFLRAGDTERGGRYGVLAAEIHARRLEVARAIQLYEEVARVAPSISAPGGRTVAERIGDLHFQTGEHCLVVNALESLLGDLRANAAAERFGAVALLLARSHSRLGNYRRAAELSREVTSCARGEQFDELVADLALACAEVHASKGNHLESLRCCERLESRQGSKLDDSRRSRLLRIMAECHEQLDDHASAAELSQAALRVAERGPERDRPEVGVFLLGKHLYYRGKLRHAIRQFEVAARLAKTLGLAEERAAALLELGKIHLAIERPRRAFACLELAHRIYRHTGNIARGTEAAVELGEARRGLGDHEEAKRAFAAGLSNAEQLGNPQLLARACLGLAGLCLDAGDRGAVDAWLSRVDEARAAPSSRLEMARRELLVRRAIEAGDLRSVLAEIEWIEGEMGREGNRLAHANVLWQKAEVLLRCDERVAARRIAVTLLEAAKRSEYVLASGRAKYIEGMLFSADGKKDLADRAFQAAEEVFRGEGWERGLVALYHDQGVHCLRAGDLESAYLHFEEGFYLAKRLGLAYEKCRFYTVMGVLEMLLPEGQVGRAEERLLLAEQLANAGGYGSVSWRIHWFLATLYGRAGRSDLESEHLESSEKALAQLVANVPIRYRGGFRRATEEARFSDLLAGRAGGAPPNEE